MRKRKLEIISTSDATKLINIHPCCRAVKDEGLRKLYGYLVNTDHVGKKTFTMVCQVCYEESPE